MVTIDRNFCNVICLGMSFMVLFISEFAITNMQKTLFTSIHEEKPAFTVDAYTSLGITFTVFALSLWLAPSVVSVTGPRYGMVLAAIAYTIYILSFIVEEEWAVYVVTVIGGVGASILWTSEGKYLVLNSDSTNVSRNIGIFWVFLQSASLIGNIFTFIKFKGKRRIDAETRHQVIWVLGAFAAASILGFLSLGKPKENLSKSIRTSGGFVFEFKKTLIIFIRKEILILMITFIFTGLQHAFVYGVYSPSIGFTTSFGTKAKQLVALSGITIGVGEILGGLFQVAFNKVFSKFNLRLSSVIMIGFCSQLTAYILIYLNIPDSASYGETNENSIIQPSEVLAILCSLLLGFGDSCLNTQNLSIIAVLFPKDSAQSCALYFFIKSLAEGIGFFVTSYVGLHTQLMILVSCGAISAIAFTYIDKNITKSKWSNEERKSGGGCEEDKKSTFV